DRLAFHESDRGRTDEQLVDTLDARLSGRTLDEGVLRDPILGRVAESATQLIELGHGEATVLGDNSCRAVAELVRDLGDGRHLVGLRHGRLLSWLVTTGSPGPTTTKRPSAAGAGRTRQARRDQGEHPGPTPASTNLVPPAQAARRVRDLRFPRPAWERPAVFGRTAP